jgi:hypothetical protein
MSTSNKNFKVKNGLNVTGQAVFNSDVILGTTPLAFDTQTSRLKVQVDGQWLPLALLSDADVLVFNEDIGLTIDYDGNPVFIIQGNGINVSGTSKFLDGGNPNTTTVRYEFDAGVIA